MSTSAAVRTYRCDDAGGFELRVVRGNDGDFHLSVVPRLSDLEKEGMEAGLYDACYSASMRVRVPLIGGGSHEHLYHALAKLWRDEDRAPSRRTEIRE